MWWESREKAWTPAITGRRNGSWALVFVEENLAAIFN
jgi:hypothetical protein